MPASPSSSSSDESSGPGGQGGANGRVGSKAARGEEVRKLLTSIMLEVTDELFGKPINYQHRTAQAARPSLLRLKLSVFVSNLMGLISARSFDGYHHLWKPNFQQT
eukprot:scaffold261612_cov24-Prasinocladus_malaysianus.AAC.1